MKPTPEELRDELRSGRLAHLAGPLEEGITQLNKLAEQIGAAALDPKVDLFGLRGGGGAAFLWEDLLSLEDAADAADGMWGALDPATQVKLVLKLVLFWRKLRGIRVNLDRE